MISTDDMLVLVVVCVSPVFSDRMIIIDLTIIYYWHINNEINIESCSSFVFDETQKSIKTKMFIHSLVRFFSS